MPATNHTQTLGLSQFEATDKPAWLADYNDDMATIDEFATTIDQKLQDVPQKDGTLQVNLNAEMLGGQTIAEIQNDVATQLSGKASLDETATQTLSGPLVAGGGQLLETAQVRNIIFSTTDLEAGTSPLETGTLYLVYEV